MAVKSKRWRTRALVFFLFLLVGAWFGAAWWFDRLGMCPRRAAMLGWYDGEDERIVAIGGRTWRISQRKLPPISRPPSMISVYDTEIRQSILMFAPNKSYFYGLYDVNGDGELDFYFVERSRYTEPRVYLHPFSKGSGRLLADYGSGRAILFMISVYSYTGLVLLIFVPPMLLLALLGLVVFAPRMTFTVGAWAWKKVTQKTKA